MTSKTTLPSAYRFVPLTRRVALAFALAIHRLATAQHRIA
jgi:hypothetical protein